MQKHVLMFLCGTIATSVATAATAEESKGLETIVVTAQRRVERLQDVPMAIAVVSGATMEKSGALGVHDVSLVAPGVQINFNGLNTMATVRGVGSASNGITAENNVALYIDGLYQSDSIAVNADLPNIENVQVLKGPQGTLYGRNATGGAILVTTKAPSKTWTGLVGAGYAEFNEKTFSGYLSGPINDRVRFALAAYSRTGDGYLKFSDPVTGGPTDRNVAPNRYQNAQLKFEADLADNLTATLGYRFALTDDARSAQFTPFAHVSPTLPAPPARSTSPDLKSNNDPNKTLDFAHELSLNLVWRTSIGELTSTSGYLREKLKGAFDVDGTYAPLTWVSYGYNEETYQSNLNYQITAIKDLALVIGGTYYNDKRTFPYSSLTFINRALFSTVYNLNTRDTYQLYVDGTYNISDALSLTVGGGYSHERTSLTFAQKNGAGVITIPPVKNTTSFKKFTPKASLRYAFDRDTSVYLSYAEGFKAGLWTPNMAPVVPVKQETIKAYELGLKMVRPQFRFDAAGFYYDYTDLQVSAVIPDPTCTLPPTQCTLRQFVTNGPKARIYGIDGQVTLTPAERLNVRLGAAWVHARYRSFTNAVGTGLNAATGLNVNPQTQDFTGLPLQRSPSFSGNIGVDYDLLTSYGDVLFATNVKFTTSYVPSDGSTYGVLASSGLVNKQRYVQEGYVLVNGNITWTDPSGHYSVGAFVRNLTDKKYWITYNSSARGDYGTYAAPRTFGGRVKYMF
jgi:iron complex outermembrane receptor protein